MEHKRLNCSVCGAEFFTFGWNKFRCDECQHASKREKANAHDRAVYALTHPGLPEIVCCDCGVTVKAGSASAKRCSPCSALNIKKLRKSMERKYQKKARKSGKNCSRCGKPTGKPGICDRCSKYVIDWKKANPKLVAAAKKKRVSQRRSTYWKLLDSLLVKQKGKCALCGKKAEKWHLDHKIPVSLGGCSEPFNFQALCVWCNLHKGAKIIDPKADDRQLRLVA